jgi:hypothetical protein
MFGRPRKLNLAQVGQKVVVWLATVEGMVYRMLLKKTHSLYDGAVAQSYCEREMAGSRLRS